MRIDENRKKEESGSMKERYTSEEKGEREVK